MSGPKAFRIVTRAEIIAICRRNLARLDAAIETWTSSCWLNGTIQQADVDKVIARRDELRRLLETDRFIELQKQVPAEISYLQTDAERRAANAAEAEARSKRDGRRTKAAAHALLARFQATGIDVPTQIRDELTASEASSDRLNAAISRGMLLLYPTDQAQGATNRQRELADRLGAGERRISLEEWISQQPASAEDTTLLRVDDLLGELKGLGIDPSPFSARVAALEAEASSRRALIADSLLLDLAQMVKDGRERARILGDLRERQAELSEMSSPEATSLRSEIDDALAGRSADASELIKRADFLVEAEVRAMAAAERRRTVLEGLASLGYEVSEGMATAWVDGGRVVLRKPANPGYGVELSGGSQSDLLQVRAVGIGNPAEVRDMHRDRDMETIWCGDFMKFGEGDKLDIRGARCLYRSRLISPRRPHIRSFLHSSRVMPKQVWRSCVPLIPSRAAKQPAESSRTTSSRATNLGGDAIMMVRLAVAAI